MKIVESFLRVPRTVEALRVDQLALFPVRALAHSIRKTKLAIDETVSLVRPASSQREFARSLAAEDAMKKAARAAEDVEIGQQSGISEIVFMGRAALAGIVITAKHSPLIDRQVRSQIAHIAEKMEVDTEFEPLLTDEEQAAYRDACQRYDNVFDISTYR